MKPRLNALMEGDPHVGIEIDGIGVEILGRLVDWKEDMTDILEI